MKNIDLEKIKQETIDGELVLFPSDNQWRLIFDGEQIGGNGLFHLTGTEKLRQIVGNNNNNLRMGIRQLTPGTGCWTYIVFLQGKDSKWHRVFLESIKCKKCGSIYWSANPDVYELYFGTYDVQEVEKAAMEYAKNNAVNCPNCDANLEPISLYLLDMDGQPS